MRELAGLFGCGHSKLWYAVTGRTSANLPRAGPIWAGGEVADG
jgi:hypothetical protein